jgi:hypothetical protein
MHNIMYVLKYPVKMGRYALWAQENIFAPKRLENLEILTWI